MLTLIPIALLSGVLTVFSPCVLPILPVILASGADGNKKRVNGIILGIVLSFTVASLFLTAIITALGISADGLRLLAAALLGLIGLSIIFPIWEKIQVHMERIFNKPVKPGGGGFKGGLATGVGLGIAWTPCVGPIVATVSTLAAVNQLSMGTIFLVLFYAIGLGIPLWLIANNGGAFTSRLGLFKSNPVLVRKIFGIILVLTAVFVFFGFEKRVQAWFLDNLPEKWAFLSTTLETSFNVEERLIDMKLPKSSLPLSCDKAIAKVDPDDIVQVLGADGIPSIDDPKFETVVQGDAWLDAEDIIFGVNHNGIKKAYPQRILNWHEIVNDKFGDDAVAVTFCPLCGTGVSFISEINGEAVELGVSGKLYNSDLVMYDRNEGSLWLQATGEAICGSAAERDETLEWVATTTTSWELWKNKHPNTQVLSRDTGFNRDYDRYPYGNYEESERLIFGVENDDDRFHRKAITYGITLDDGIAKAYLLEDLQKTISANESIEDTVGGKTVVIVHRSDAEEYTFVEKETGENIIPLRGFWFAWAAFHPNTEVFEP